MSSAQKQFPTGQVIITSPVVKLGALLLFAALSALTWSATAAPGDVDTSFNPDANNSVNSIALQRDGKIVTGGNFTTMGGVARNYIARLNTDGTLDTNFKAYENVGGVSTTGLQTDGKIIIGGAFYGAGDASISVSRNDIARFHADGTLDMGFDPNANNYVSSSAVQTDGKIVIGGGFTHVSGVTRNHLARLNPDGTLDSTFNPNVNFQVKVIAVQTDGKIVIGGSFNSVSGATRNYIARLNADGSLDSAFNPNANASVSSAILQADGKIVVGGNFTTVGGIARNYITRLNADGTLDTGFDPNANASVSTMALQTDGKIVIGGEFTSVGGVVRNRLARLNADGTLDATFDPNANNYVSSMVLQADGSVVIGGGFTMVGVVPRNRLARLTNDVATQSLTVTNTSRVQWLRGGTSPETPQVTFDLSTNGGGTWTSLGFGVRISGGWELAALGLPASGQVRARARVCGGDGVSSGLVEAVTVFSGLPVPAATEIAVEQPALTDIPDSGSKSFGSVLVGSNASLTFIIKNVGTSDLTGLGITIDGANAAEFTITGNPTAPVSGNGSTTFTVRFAPTTTGAKTAALHIANNDANENPFDINLSGAGISPEIAVEQPALTDIPDGGSKSFGSVLLGSNASLTFIIKNIGNADLTGLGITIDGTNAADFTIITNATAPVAGPSDSTTFTVRFCTHHDWSKDCRPAHCKQRFRREPV